MKAFHIFLGLLLALPITGCNDQEKKAATMPLPKVGVMKIEPQDIPHTFSFHAEAQGSKSAEIRAQVSGILVSRDYDEGTPVKKGQLLFTIEPDKYRAALEQAKGKYRQTEATYVQTKRDNIRIKTLYEKNAVSQRDRDNALAAFETAEADLYSAKAAVDSAQVDFDHAYVTAPISGFASKERHTIGNLINPSSSTDSLLTTIYQPDPMYVNFSVASSIIMQIRYLVESDRLSIKDSYCELEFNNGIKYKQQGKIAFFDWSIDSTTDSVPARATFPNPNHILLPGQFLRISVKGPKLLNAIMIPQQAILQTQYGPVIAVVDKDGKADFRPIKTNPLSAGEWFLVDDGLKAGDLLVVDGVARVNRGGKVQIDEEMNKHVAEKFKLIQAKTTDEK